MDAELGLPPPPHHPHPAFANKAEAKAVFQVGLPMFLGHRQHLLPFAVRQASGLGLDTSNLQPRLRGEASHRDEGTNPLVSSLLLLLPGPPATGL